MGKHRKHRRKRSLKVGLPPGTIVHVGEERSAPVDISLFTYDAAHFDEEAADSPEGILVRAGDHTVTWVNVNGVHDTDCLAGVGQHFGLHPLVMEDVANTAQRPKCDDYHGTLFVVAKMLQWDNARQDVHFEQVSFVLGKDFLVTFQEEPGDVFDQIRDRIRTGKGRMRQMGPDYLLYCLLDAIVDNYFLILERIGDQIEELEEVQLTNPSPETLKAVRQLRHEVTNVRRALWPMRDVVGALERGKNPLIGEETGLYVRDLYDHAVQIIETVETYRDQLASVLDIYLSSISNKMNEVMKVLTIIATIFIPLTFIAGLYGMNFQGGGAGGSNPLNMPELYWPYGYVFCLSLMAATAIGLVLYFRKKKWL